MIDPALVRGDVGEQGDPGDVPGRPQARPGAAPVVDGRSGRVTETGDADRRFTFNCDIEDMLARAVAGPGATSR